MCGINSDRAGLDFLFTIQGLVCNMANQPEVLAARYQSIKSILFSDLKYSVIKDDEKNKKEFVKIMQQSNDELRIKMAKLLHKNIKAGYAKSDMMSELSNRLKKIQSKQSNTAPSTEAEKN